jgi:replicative DNA helicase
MEITKTILQHLLHNEEYTRKVCPYLKESYFESAIDQTVFRLIKSHLDRYNKRPTQEVLQIGLDAPLGLTQTQVNDCKSFISELTDEPQDLDWLIDTTEAWCKERAIFNGLFESIEIIKDKSGKKSQGQIVKILEDAISVSFDHTIGHDYLEDADARYEFYHRVQSRTPFDIQILNTITNGGLPHKTLTIVMGGVGIGKTATMCHFAAADMVAGINVLYITLEMAEEEIAKRIDANLLDTRMDDLSFLSKENYDKRVQRVRDNTPGKLIIKEYPTGGASVAHFRHLLHELKFKKKFIPSKIYVDYLNIMASSRVKLTSNIGLYSFVQSVVQEVRGLAVEFGVPIVSATQLNREGFASSDPNMEHIAESFGTAATADLILVITASPELIALNQISVKQIKNRFGDLNKNTRFILGRDLDKMRLYETENHSTLISGPVINTTADKFEGFKY